ncbi:MAG TPA: hypothetical protein VE685_15465 [Thermoanaerobaculia bacterium]|nr:hypothetical protein [Thermoanaerobaculia bacterium]
MAIAWDSDTNAISGTTAPTMDVLKADLDLWVMAPSGDLKSTSTSWDNSFEIVEFTASLTGTYTAEVRAYRFQGQSEYLAVAWWTGAREDY